MTDVVLTSSVDQWFQKDGEEVWHKNTTADPIAKCGQTRLRYGIDNTADQLPQFAKACALCVNVDAIPAAAPSAQRKPRAPRQPKAPKEPKATKEPKAK